MITTSKTIGMIDAARERLLPTLSDPGLIQSVEGYIARAEKSVSGGINEQELAAAYADLRTICSPEMIDIDELCELIEDGDATVGEIMHAIKLAREMSDEEMMSIDMFGPSDGEVLPLGDRVLRGRKDHVDQLSKASISKGERHRHIVELFDGSFYDTRHCELSCWVASEGRGMPSKDVNGERLPDQEFIKRYAVALNRISELEDRKAA